MDTVAAEDMNSAPGSPTREGADGDATPKQDQDPAVSGTNVELTIVENDWRHTLDEALRGLTKSHVCTAQSLFPL